MIAIDVDRLAAAIAERLAPASPVERPPVLLDRAGLARELCVSVGTLDRLRNEGMPELRVGDAPRFELSEVLAWLRARSASNVVPISRAKR